MIPKKIHYCWFGRGKMPESAINCINSWKKFLPDYEIKEWNEDNFDLNLYPYTREAYDNRKYAFVTDVVRLYALYYEGGVYMDTDVEVLKPIDNFLDNIAFSGYESETTVPTGIMASVGGGGFVKDCLAYYEGRHFIQNDGSLDTTTNVITITNYLRSKGLRQDNTYQNIPGLITIFPKDFFCPKSYNDGKIYNTENTVCIHHFAGSWVPWEQQLEKRIWAFLGLSPHRIIYHVEKYIAKTFHIIR